MFGDDDNDEDADSSENTESYFVYDDEDDQWGPINESLEEAKDRRDRIDGKYNYDFRVEDNHGNIVVDERGNEVEDTPSEDEENPDEGETYTEYVVYDRWGVEVGQFDTPEEAEVMKSNHYNATIETEEVPLYTEDEDDESDLYGPEGHETDPETGERVDPTESTDEPETLDDDEVDEELQSPQEMLTDIATDNNEEDESTPEEAWSEDDDDHNMPERDDSGVEVLDEDETEESDEVHTGYDFWRTSDMPSELTADGETQRWTLGDHEVRHDMDTDAIREAAADINGVDPELAEVLENAADKLSSAGVSGFECPVCGLNHNHSDTKHDIRSESTGFSVRTSFADFMEFVPYCHCGVNELAMLIDFYGHIDMPLFEDSEKFAGAQEIRNDTLIDICNAIKASEEDYLVQTLTVDAASRELDESVSPNLDGDIQAFYKRWKAIKNAADGAPIAGSTRTRINEVRSGLNEKFNY